MAMQVAPTTEVVYSPYADGRAVDAAEPPRATDAFAPGRTQDDREMRVVELVVAGAAILASLFLSLPK